MSEPISITIGIICAICFAIWWILPLFRALKEVCRSFIEDEAPLYVKGRMCLGFNLCCFTGFASSLISGALSSFLVFVFTGILVSIPYFLPVLIITAGLFFTVRGILIILRNLRRVEKSLEKVNKNQ